MKFEEMKYKRPDLKETGEAYEKLMQRLQKAESFAEADSAFIEKDTLDRHLATASAIAQIRHDTDTTDAFYKEESHFWDGAFPTLQKYQVAFMDLLMNSPYRKDFEEKYGNLMFLNAQLEKKSFSPAIAEDMQEESRLANEYEDLLASAQVPFEGKLYTLSQMTPFKNDPDDERRLQAWKAEGQWYKDHEPEMDEIYDKLVHLRDSMGKKMGYEGYTTLGYYRMGRNCWTKEDIEHFRNAVVKYVVPVADATYHRQAERLGKSYPMSFADNALSFRSGNPKPSGNADELVEAASKFYHELSKETDEFFQTMRKDDLLNLLSTKGKRGGGYTTGLPDYKVPYIFANFNGTQGDVEVLTHEAGHAFEAWMNRDRVPLSYMWPTMEACECHSMSMEFFGEKWAEDFFGKDAEKYCYAHLAGALQFIPYGTMVDHFQHEVYANPDWTPRQRHDCWKKLMGVYMPWEKLDGEIPFYSDGEHWQLKHHIYSSPFYYIDYCLAQTVSLEFWAMIQEDEKNAWDHYMRYTRQGGTKVFTGLLKEADLASPFDEKTLKNVCEKAEKYLEQFDLSNM